MAEAGIVKFISGYVVAVDSKDVQRVLRLNDVVGVNDTVVTADTEGTRVVIRFGDGSSMELQNSSQVKLKDKIVEGSKSLLIYSENEVADIQQALENDPDFDPTTDLPATAAGGIPAAGGALTENNGISFVEVDYLNPEITPSNGFETNGINAGFSVLQEDFILNPQLVPLEPAIFLIIDAGADFIKEDRESFIQINSFVDNPDAEQLQTITITQLPADVIVDFSELKSVSGVIADSGDGVNSPLILTLQAGITAFSGRFSLIAPEDSDIDLGEIVVQAVAEHIETPTLQVTALDSLSIVVDAVLDERVDIEQEQGVWVSTSRRGGEVIPLKLEFNMVDSGFPNALSGNKDTDGSENVNSVEIVLDDDRADLSLHQYSGQAKLTGNANSGYSLTDYADLADLKVAIGSLAVTSPSIRFYDGTMTGTIRTLTKDDNLNSGLELDGSDNEVQGVFQFYARVGDKYDAIIQDNSATPENVGVRVVGSTLILDSEQGEVDNFSLDFSQLLIEPSIQQYLNQIDNVNISGSHSAQEDNTLTLSIQNVLDFYNDSLQQQLTITGDSGDTINLLAHADNSGNWTAPVHDSIEQSNSYAYISAEQVLAKVIIDESVAVNINTVI